MFGRYQHRRDYHAENEESDAAMKKMREFSDSLEYRQGFTSFPASCGFSLAVVIHRDRQPPQRALNALFFCRCRGWCHRVVLTPAAAHAVRQRTAQHDAQVTWYEVAMKLAHLGASFCQYDLSSHIDTEHGNLVAALG